MLNQYDLKTLNKLQSIETEMLRKLDSVCKKYDIEYFINFGTAIGAVRHQGFIPWDDDIDVGMMREEYEKLKKVPKTEWGDMLFVDPTDDVVFHRCICPRLYKEKTIFETKRHFMYDRVRKNVNDEKIPIWLDIWVYDRVNSMQTIEKISNKAFKLQRLYFYAKCGVNVIKEDSIQFKIRCFLKNIMHKLMNLVKRPELIIYKKFLKLVANNPQGKYVTCFSVDYTSEMKNLMFLYDEMFPVVRVKFSDFDVSIQKNYDEMLKKLYGNYMQLPPVEKRFNHPPAILNFGDDDNVVGGN